MNSRLAIGTVQFGMDYGLAESTRVPMTEIKAILDLALSNDLDTLDTAVCYGESETVLGHVGIDRWKTITKLPPLPNELTGVAPWVFDQVANSLDRLKIPQLYGLLIHRSADLQGKYSNALYSSLIECKKRGLTKKVGLSIYSPAELDLTFAHFPIDLVQAPFNILDDRLITSGWLTRLKEAGVEVHARSIFLQGLLLLAPKDRPDNFHRWDKLLSQWDTWLNNNAISPIDACMDFALNAREIDRIVVGLNSADQLRTVLERPTPTSKNPPPMPTNTDCDLINPARWHLL